MLPYPFPAKYPNVLNYDTELQIALDKSIDEAKLNFQSISSNPRFAISIVAIDEIDTAPTFRCAGYHDKEVHYSASLLKVAAMYAAFQIRQSARNFALSTFTTTPSELFAQMSLAFDYYIDTAVPLISNDAAIQPSMKTPKYVKILDTSPQNDGGYTFEFTPLFLDNMEKMIINSDNSAAATCIQNLGYSWINGALTQGGFFDSNTNLGIWLAGTFTGSWPYVRVLSVNDGLVAQATTCFDLANLYALIFRRTQSDNSHVDKASCEQMLQLLGEATKKDPSWMTRDDIRPNGIIFSETHTKIGVGPLKKENGGFEVYSEGSIVQTEVPNKKFIVVWQNCDSNSLVSISYVVNRTIKLALGIL